MIGNDVSSGNAITQRDLVALLETALPLEAHSTSSVHHGLQRQVLSATLRTLAAWLHEQATRMTDSSPLLDDSHAPPNPLTNRERDVAVRIAGGLSNREIAQDLVITVSTTERHVANILNKLGMRSRAQIAVWAIEAGLLGSPRT